jgi:hypothetical protein
MLTTDQARELAVDIAGDLGDGLMRSISGWVEERSDVIVPLGVVLGLEIDDLYDAFGRRLILEGRRMRREARRSRRRGVR